MTLYHGSVIADIKKLEPRSKLHGSPDEKVVYLSSSMPDSHERMFYSAMAVPVIKWGLVRDVSRFIEVSEEVQAERIKRAAIGFRMNHLLDKDTGMARFMQKNNKRAWELAGTLQT